MIYQYDGMYVVYGRVSGDVDVHTHWTRKYEISMLHLHACWWDRGDNY
jgi:hypothetical protein